MNYNYNNLTVINLNAIKHNQIGSPWANFPLSHDSRLRIAEVIINRRYEVHLWFYHHSKRLEISRKFDSLVDLF